MRMNRIASALILGFAMMPAIADAQLVGSPAPANSPVAACRRPAPLAPLPDGRTAVPLELKLAEQNVTAYANAMLQYIDCLDAERQAAASERDAAVTGWQRVLDEYQTSHGGKRPQ